MSRRSEGVRSGQARALLLALCLAAAWSLALTVFTRRLSQNYFPIGDEWALLANSDLTIRSPLTWLTDGFSDYFEFDPALSVPYANFVRPVDNLTYWFLGLWFSPSSPWRLRFHFVVIGAAAALTYLCAAWRDGDRASWLALPLCAAVPLLPAFLPSRSFLVPYNQFDALAAVFCLAAYLACRADRYGAVVVLATTAVLTKETALPVAAAIPLYVLVRDLAAVPRRSGVLFRVTALALPILVWMAVRWLAFGSISGGTYALGEGWFANLRGVFQAAFMWPVFTPLVPTAFTMDRGSLLAIVPVAANLLLTAGLACVVVKRFRRDRRLELSDLCWLGSYGFMLFVIPSARYGSILEVFLVVSLIRAYRDDVAPRLIPIMMGTLSIALVFPAYFTWKEYPDLERLIVAHFRIAKRYVSVLAAYGPSDTVVVLNDPVTWHSRIEWLTAASHIEAHVLKAADFACPVTSARLNDPTCSVALEPEASSHRFRFRQSCGFEFCGTMLPQHDPVVERRLAEGIVAELRREQLPPLPWTNAPRWDTMVLTVDRANVRLVYFDPATRRFETKGPFDHDP